MRPRWLPPDEFGFESRYIDIDGNAIHYVDEGSGPALLLVHAGPAWLFVFRHMIEDLLTEFRCVAVDFPGSGLSVSTNDRRPGLEQSSRVLEAFIDALDLRDATVIAHDLGAPAVLGVATRRPELLGALAVTEGFAWSLNDEHPKVARMLRIVGGRGFGAVNDVTNVLARGTSTRFGVGRHLSRAGRRAFRGPFRDRRVRRRALAMLRDASQADTYLRQVDGWLRAHWGARPLLLVFGEKSPTLRAGFVDAWQARVPHARVLVIEGAHHFPQMDDSPAVCAAIRSWWHEAVAASPNSRRS